MQVPYATKWQPEIEALRGIALDCSLVEQTKWGKPCFTFQQKNIAIVIPLKESCALNFFKGALLQDPKHLLEKIGEHTQSARWVKFTSADEITARRAVLKQYFLEAIRIEAAGATVQRKTLAEYVVPAELQALFAKDKALAAAFAALTPGRKKSLLLHIGDAKQSSTRATRAQKCVPLILSGRGFNERSR